MKKNLFMLICMLFSMIAVRADILTPSYKNIEIGGFVYDLDDIDDDGYGSGIVTNITDEKLAEVNESRELKFPSTVVYEGITFTIFSVSESLCDGRSFDNVEYVELPEEIANLGISNMANLQEIAGLKSVVTVSPNGLTNLPTLKSLDFSVNKRVLFFQNSLANVGVEKLEISLDDSSRDGLERCIYDLPELTDLHIGFMGHLKSYCFYNMPKLTTLTIDTVAGKIGSGCFCDLPQLRSLTIKKLDGGLGMTRNAFLNTPMLSDVYVEDTNPDVLYCSMQEDGFYPPRMTLHVPVGSREAYATADGWKSFGEIVDDVVSGVDTTAADNEGNGWSCTATTGGIAVSADNDVTVEVVTPAGAVVKRVAVGAGETVSAELPAGVYIVAANGQSAKVCVR